MALMSMSTRKRHHLLASNNYDMPNKYIIDISLHDLDIYGSMYAMFRYLWIQMPYQQETDIILM
jgi:hypothetical protein